MSKIDRIHKPFAGQHSVIGTPYAAGTALVVWAKSWRGTETSEAERRRLHLFEWQGGRALRMESWLFQPTEIVKTEDGLKWRLFQQIDGSAMGAIVMRPDGYQIWIPDPHWGQLQGMLDDWITRHEIVLPDFTS